MLIRRAFPQGFTLVELLIGIVVAGILVLLAAPSFSAWIQNLRIRNTAESILNGMQLAKGQAVQSNASTEFVLVTVAPVVGNVGAAASASGTNWIVRRVPAAGYVAADFIQGRAGTEGSANVTVAASQGSFIFTPLGRLLNPPAAAVNIDVTTGASYTGKRPMRIVVSPGGQMLMCDPGKVDPTNPQFCP